MPESVQKIINDIEYYIRNKCNFQNYEQFYIGITKDIETRLFGSHSVPSTNYCWIWREAFCDTDARAVESYFLGLGMQGGQGGGDEESKYVYVYKVGLLTNESVVPE